MKKCSSITQAQSRTTINALKGMSIDSFEDAIMDFQAEISSQQIGTEKLSDRESSSGNTSGPASFQDVIGIVKEYRHEEEAGSGISVEGQYYEPVDPPSDSEDWEDCSDDGESIVEKEDGGC